MKTFVDYIVKLESFVPQDLCDLILKEYKESDDWQQSTMSGFYSPDVRTCDLINMSDPNVIQKNYSIRSLIDSRILQTVISAGDEYKKIYPRAVFNCDTGYHLLRYKTGQFIKHHVDTSNTDHRVVSCSIQLNSKNEFTGGEWEFFEGETFSMTQDKGDMVMFPSNFCYPHQIKTIESGVRYSIITWLNHQV